MGKRKKTDRQKLTAAASGDGDLPTACLCVFASRPGRQVTVEWIGQRLEVGSRHTVANSLKTE